MAKKKSKTNIKKTVLRVAVPLGYGSDWLSVVGVASHLKVSKETVYRWLKTKSVPAYRVGKLWKFHRLEIDGWVKSGGPQ